MGHKDTTNKTIIAIKNTDATHINHTFPDTISANFSQNDSKLSCQWMTNRDSIQNKQITINIFFKTQPQYEAFTSLFLQTLQTETKTANTSIPVSILAPE